MPEIGKFDIEISVLPNILEKKHGFIINKNLAFTESMQFMNSSLDNLLKTWQIMVLNIYLKTLMVKS